MKMIKLAIITGVILLLFKGATGRTDQEYVFNLLDKQAKIHDLDPALVKAVTRVESNFNIRAKNPADPSYGLMQITPMLAQDWGYVKDYKNPSPEEIERLYDPKVNTEIGCGQLSYLSSFGYNCMVHAFNVGLYGYFKGTRNYPYFDLVSKYYEKYKAI